MEVKVFYSKSTNGFYVDGVLDSIPEDVVEVGKQDFLAIQSQLSSGKSLSSDKDGNPRAVDNIPTDDEYKISVSYDKSRFMQKAMTEISILNYKKELGVSTKKDDPKAVLWKQYIVDLSEIEKQKDYPVTVVWPNQPN